MKPVPVDAYAAKSNRCSLRLLKYALIERARRKHGKIRPCAGCATLDECFCVHDNELLLWYNDPSIDSTHLEHTAFAPPRRRTVLPRRMKTTNSQLREVPDNRPCNPISLVF